MVYLCDYCNRYPCADDDYKMRYTCPGFLEKPKPMTNADRIRAMTDEELSQFLCSWHNAEECHHCVAERFCEYGHTGMIDWLQQEDEK